MVTAARARAGADFFSRSFSFSRSGFTAAPGWAGVAAEAGCRVAATAAGAGFGAVARTADIGSDWTGPRPGAILRSGRAGATGGASCGTGAAGLATGLTGAAGAAGFGGGDAAASPPK